MNLNFPQKSYIDQLLETVNNNTLKHNPENLRKIHSCIDLTTLSTTDNYQTVKQLVDSVNNHSKNFPEIPNVAGICVYPRFVDVVKENLKVENVDIVSVAGAFPHSQTFTEVKIKEIELAIKSGADEIDVVINAGDVINENYDFVKSELSAMRNACKNHTLKIILESGLYQNDNQIYAASMLAMESGADFIKTSTGKCNPAAEPRAVVIMVVAAKDFMKTNNKKIGIKPAGGIRTTDQALTYATIISQILGENFFDKSTFRLGATSLSKNVINDLKNF